jgi:cytoplasmic iron level regulating protein YaaA (DUF328/UPF0246 family)
VLLLLPPSEGKTAPAEGSPVDLTQMSFPTLTKTRDEVLRALVDLCRTDPSAALKALKLSASQEAEVVRDAELEQAPNAPAAQVYTGVLFEALALRDLTPAARRRANEQVRITSALWGLLRPSDQIPAYRLSAGASLPGLDHSLRRRWSAPISDLLGEYPDLLVDLRSYSYRELGPIPFNVARRTALIRVLTDQAGKRITVSHHNKATKGRLVHALLKSRRDPATPRQLATHLRNLGFTVELGPRTSDGVLLDVIV